MELKVYVEGIQRVVCGVTEATTCQDVVIALAHAIGKTGRFTLIEQWRNNERLLAPSEHPLKVLQKWGEYAADVMFILKYSEKDSNDGSAKRTDKFLHDFTPHETRWSGRSSGRGLKKSLTFSGAHNLSSPKPSRNRHPRRGLPTDSSLDSLDERCSLASCSSRSSTSPYASLENRHLRHRNVPFQQVNPFGSLDRHKRTQAVRPSLHFSPHSGSGGSATSSLERRPRRTLPLHGSPRAVDSHQTNHQGDTKGVIEEYDLDRHLGDLPPKVNGIGGFREPHLAEKEVVGSNGGDREDLIKLVKLQQERLSVQESQIKVLDSEIGFWEDREKEQGTKIKVIQEEIESLNRHDVDLEDQIQELDLVSWVDKLEIEKQRQKTLQSELTLLRSKVSNCEAQILQKKSKIHKLIGESDQEKTDRIKEERAEQQRDMKVLQDISQLHKEINAKLEEHRITSDNLEKIQNEIKDLDAALLDKKAKAKDTERDIRETNLHVFMASPSSTDHVLSRPEEKPFPRRPNSARKLMHSPLFLKDSAPTANNPHGYWV